MGRRSRARVARAAGLAPVATLPRPYVPPVPLEVPAEPVDPRHVRPPAPHPATTLSRRRPLSPVGELAAVKRARTRLDTRESVAVEVARAAGMSWQDIADALGLPLTTVHRRFR